MYSRDRGYLYSDALWLHMAAARDDVATVKMLLIAGVSVNASDEETNTPLHTAARYGSTAVAKLLLSALASVNVQNSEANTPLHLAAWCGRTLVVKLLLWAGASVNAADRWANTSLHYAAMSGCAATEVMKKLLNAGAPVNALNEEACTPLHFAARYGRAAEAVKLLLSAGASVNAADRWANTSLHYAALNGCAATKDIMKLLLSAGAWVNVLNGEANTPLHLAAQCGRTAAMEVLLDAGANVNAANAQLRTPLCSANRNCKEFLQQHVAKRMALNWFVNEANSSAITSDSTMISFQLNCKQEIELMKGREIVKGISFFDLMTKGTNQLAMYARNKDIAKVFQSDVNVTIFPLFGTMIKNRFIRAIERKELMVSGHIFFDLFLTDLPRLVSVCSEKILMLLSNSDLQVFRDLLGLDRL